MAYYGEGGGAGKYNVGASPVTRSMYSGTPSGPRDVTLRRTSPPTRAASASAAPQMPFQPEAPRASGIVNTLQQTGEGLINPESDYSRRLMEQLTQDVGQQAAARGRGATLDAIRSGYGGGQSAELLETQGDISRGATEAVGDAAADYRLAAPQLGISALSPALSGEIGLQGQRLSAFMGQQGLQADQQQNEIRNQLEADRLRNEAMLRELSLLM